MPSSVVAGRALELHYLALLCLLRSTAAVSILVADARTPLNVPGGHTSHTNCLAAVTDSRGSVWLPVASCWEAISPKQSGRACATPLAKATD